MSAGIHHQIGRRAARVAQSLARRRGPVPPPKRVRWGDLRRLAPLCPHFGFSRGTPVDRHYIDAFIGGHRHRIRGDVLEVETAVYTRTFGAPGVRSHVLDIDRDNRRATLFRDLCLPGSLPMSAYDTVILTQVVQLLRDPTTALANAWDSLRPGGDILITVPTMSKLAYGLTPGTDFWRWTPDGLDLQLRRDVPHATRRVEGRGNLLACVAYLMGMALEELTEEELRTEDPVHPLIVTAHLSKPL